MRIVRVAAVCASLILFYIDTACAAGSAGAQILSYDFGARPTAMGGAYAAIADDVNAIMWNPAGLIQVPGRAMAFEQSRWLDQLSLYYAAFAQPLDAYSSIGVGLAEADYGQIELVDHSGFTQSGSYGARDLLGTVSYARRFGEDGVWAWGAGAKLINQHIADEGANAYAVDLGLHYRQDEWRGGATLQNLGPGIQFRSGASPLPTLARVGAAYTFANTAVVSADMVKDFQGDFNIRLGGEYTAVTVGGVQGLLRAGYKSSAGAFSGISYGIGLRGTRWQFDLSLSPASSYSMGEWIAFTFRFGDRRSVAPKIAPVSVAAAVAPSTATLSPATLAKAVRQYKNARALMAKKDYAGAVRLLRKALALDPHYQDASRALDDIAAALDAGNKDVSRKEYEEALRDYYQGNAAAAKTKLQDALRLDPDNHKARQSLTIIEQGQQAPASQP